MDYSQIRGFNYQPSYGSTSFENWLYFNPDIVELELRRGKSYFPNMNAIRLWLSWDAFVRNPKRFADSFETALGIARKLDLMVMPILFNRWHNEFLDCGGIYLDHFMPGYSWIQGKEQFQEYLDAIVGGHWNDERIFAWDICNEPFSYLRPVHEMQGVEAEEYKWLERMYRICKDYRIKAPAGISIHDWHGRYGIERIEPISDILFIHPYYKYNPEDTKLKSEYIELLDNYVDAAAKSKKDMLVTEACWGSMDDAWHVENIRYTLTELKKRNIGWIVHALHHSLVADLHRPEYGPYSTPGNLAFIESNGEMRKGHEIFNEF